MNLAMCNRNGHGRPVRVKHLCILVEIGVEAKNENYANENRRETFIFFGNRGNQQYA